MKIRALVVDNNPVLLKAISTILIRENCTVKTAENGLHALEILEDYTPDIVFTDLIMPQVNGEQLCNILRHTKKHKKTFIVVLSATVVEDRERIMRKIDCDQCIAKGNLSEIRIHLREALQAFMDRKKSNIGYTYKDAKIPEGLQPSDVTGELLSEKRHLDKILANLYEGIIELNERGKVITVNKAALQILQHREEDIIGISIADICDWGDFQESVEDWKTNQLLEKGLTTLEIFENNPLEINQIVLTASFIPVADKGDVFALCIIRDISRQFRAEQQNRELDSAMKLIKKMDAMSCMAGGVAHDFNNLLTVIYCNLDMISVREKELDKSTTVRLHEQARKAALAAVDLTRRISCFSNFGIVSREQAGIENLVQDSVAEFFKEQPGNYHIETKKEDCLVHVDSSEINLVLGNILQNAIEAAGNTMVKIVIDRDEFFIRQLIHGQYVPAGRYARIDIEDSGKGIDKKHLFKIFDPYYSTKERGYVKGMGLGLTVVYATLRNHGGYVVVNSELGEGTKVSLYLPELLRSPDQPVGTDENPLSGSLFLLIEPDEQMEQIGKIMLKHLGLTVTAVKNGTDAILYLENLEDAPSDKKPLILLDLSEKQGSTAEKTCKLLHELDPTLKIIAMSGSILDPIMEDCKKYGFTSTLQKPYTMDSLKHVVTAAFYN